MNNKIEDFLTLNETVVYHCRVEFKSEDKIDHPNLIVDERESYSLELYLTNYRLIQITDNKVYSEFIEHFTYCNYLEGYEKFQEWRDYGTGNYGIVLNGTKYWFYSREVCKTLYDEIIRLIVEYHYC